MPLASQQQAGAAESLASSHTVQLELQTESLLPVRSSTPQHLSETSVLKWFNTWTSDIHFRDSEDKPAWQDRACVPHT